MKLNFCLPHESIYKDKVVDQVSQLSSVCVNWDCSLDSPLHDLEVL